MDTPITLLILLIIAIVIFGVPIFLLVISLIETISEWRESMRSAEDESIVEEKIPVEKKAPVRKRPKKDAGEWTPANHMR